MLRLTVAHMTFFKKIFLTFPYEISIPVAPPDSKRVRSRNKPGIYRGRCFMHRTSGPAGPHLRRTQCSPPLRGLGVPPKVCAHSGSFLRYQTKPFPDPTLSSFDVQCWMFDVQSLQNEPISLPHLRSAQIRVICVICVPLFSRDSLFLPPGPDPDPKGTRTGLKKDLKRT
jgi:hypothetical protein